MFNVEVKVEDDVSQANGTYSNLPAINVFLVVTQHL
jgi:hypothetical protein